jgi:creatinine amidohydrolase
VTGNWIETLAWPAVAGHIASGWPVVVPIGARSKEHGHHLPMQTDYLLARALADGVAAELPVLIAPVVDFGYYPAFLRYPGSQHLSADTFIAVMRDVLGRFLDQGVQQLAVINTGVSTEGPVDIAARDMLAQRGVQVPVAHIRALGRTTRAQMAQKLGGHADEAETSIILAIAPDQVDMSKARTDYGNMLDEPPSIFVTPAQFRDDPASGSHHSATGVRGDPTLATPEKGRLILADMVSELVAGLRPFCRTVP